MNKTSVKEKAKQLLVQGYSKTEVANRCGVSRRTIIRWSQQEDFIEAIAKGVNELLIEMMNDVNEELTETTKGINSESTSIEKDVNSESTSIANGVNSELIEKVDDEVALTRKLMSIQQRIDDLLVYQHSQTNLAVSTENAAFEILGICELIVTQLKQNPSEISPRMLPQIVKAASDLSKVSNDCWTRAMDARKRMKIELEGEVKYRSYNQIPIHDTSAELRNLQSRYFSRK